MKMQEMFDKTVKFAKKQGRQSVGEGGLCLYRGPDNACCFIGAFIPDNLYDKKMEGRAVVYIIDEYPEVQEFIAPEDCEHPKAFLCDLQTIHDNYRPNQWNGKFMELAKEWGLCLKNDQ